MILAIIVLAVIFIFIFRARNKYYEKHPEKIKMYKCSFCGQEFPKVIKLADGAICEQCEKVGDENWHIELFDLDRTWKNKNITCANIRQAMSDMENKRLMLSDLAVTRTSESGRIVVDDVKKMFYIRKEGRPIILHRISDIKEFYLEYEYEEIGFSSDDTTSNEVRSGNVVIKLNEVFDMETFTAHVDEKLFTQRNEVKKVFESDLVFLEEITGMKRKPIPNKIKIL